MKNYLSKLFERIAMIIIIINLQACGGKTIPRISINFTANPQLNPDINNRPSPLVVTIYHLKTLNTFQNTDFFTLSDNPKMVLGTDLVLEDQIEIKPNQTLISIQTILPETKYLTFVAAYRDLSNADWQSTIPVNKIKKKLINVLLSQDSIQLNS